MVMAKAQGNLESNQVRIIEVSGTAPVGQALDFTQSFTVNSDKVLKVEWAGRVSNNDVGGWLTDGSNVNVYLNDYYMPIAQANNRKGTATPIWLPAGTHHLKIRISGSNSFTVSGKAMLSAIEFNVE